MKRFLFIICVLMSTFSFAKKWDAVYINKLINDGKIDKVIEHYQDAYYGKERNPLDAIKIAELYIKKKDYASAMQWYDKEKQLLNSSKVNLLNYANTYRLMGEYQKALDGYLMYAANTGDANKVMELANQCERLLKLSAQISSYKLDNYTYNTKYDETNLTYIRTNAVYNSIKTEGKENKQTFSINQVVRNYDAFLEPVKAYRNNIPNLIITSLSFTKDGNMVVFAAKEKEPSKTNIKNNDKLYTAENLGGNFLNAKPLPFNSDTYTYTAPAFNNNGTTIYFESNQTGGSGGSDIWKTSLENGKWTKPVNLGKLVNTKFDEKSPFIVQDANENTLYFSSNRDGGFGGFDIFTSKKTNNIWQGAELQPAPINSADNDISIVYDNDIKSGYLSSDRKGGKGGLDIFRFTPFNLSITVKIVDSLNSKPVDYAMVQLMENEDKVEEGVTDNSGKLIFKVGRDKTFNIYITKDGYQPVMQEAKTLGKISGDNIELNVSLKQDPKYSIQNSVTNNLSLDNFVVFTGNVIDGYNNKPATSAKMRIMNYTTQKVRELELDKDGKFEIKLLQNNNYKVIFQTESNKLIDELTTYGLEKKDVKLRKYILSGSKVKITENKVYTNGNIPSNIKLTTDLTTDKKTAILITNNPITQSKIDSLKKVIAGDIPAQQTIAQKSEVVQNTVSAKPEKSTIEKPAIVEKKIIEKQVPEKPIAIKPIAEKSENTIASIDTAYKGKTIIIEKEAPQLAADIMGPKSTTKIRKEKDKIIKEQLQTSISDDSLFTIDVLDINEYIKAKKKLENVDASSVDIKKTIDTVAINETINKATNNVEEVVTATQEKEKNVKNTKVLDDKELADLVAKEKKASSSTIENETDDEIALKSKIAKTKQIKTSTINSDDDTSEDEATKAKSIVNKPAKIINSKSIADETDDSITLKNKTVKTKTAKELTNNIDETTEDESLKATTNQPVKTIAEKSTNTATNEINAVKDDANNNVKEITSAETVIQKTKEGTTSRPLNSTLQQKEKNDIVIEKNETSTKTKEDKTITSTNPTIEKAADVSINKTTTKETIAVKEVAEVPEKETTTKEINTTKKEIAESISLPENSNTKPLETTKSATTINPNIPDVSYKVQIGSYRKSNLKFPEIENLGKIDEIFLYDEYIYRLGTYYSEAEARLVLDKVRENSFFVAFILIYNKSKVVGIIK